MEDTRYQRILTPESCDAAIPADVGSAYAGVSGVSRNSYTGTASTFRPPIPEKWVQVAGLRYYSPELGRWLSRDPIGEKSDRCLHRFCTNSPIHGYDGIGLTDKDCAKCTVFQMKTLFALTGDSPTAVFREDVLDSAIHDGFEHEMLVYKVEAECYKGRRPVYLATFYGLRDLVITGGNAQVRPGDRIPFMLDDPKQRYFDGRPDGFRCVCKNVYCIVRTEYATRIHSIDSFRPSPNDQRIDEGVTNYLLVKGSDGKLYYVPYTKDSVLPKVEVPGVPDSEPAPPPMCSSE